MGYVKTEFQPKDTLPASLLNAMQDAIVESENKMTAVQKSTSENKNKIDTMQDAINNATKIFKGSYSGANGTQKTLSFDFTPKIVIVQKGIGSWGNPAMLIMVNGVTNSSLLPNFGSASSTYKDATITWSGNTVSFTSDENVLDSSGSTYHYIAIG